MKYPNLTKEECAEWDRLSMKMVMANMAAQAAAFQSIKKMIEMDHLEDSVTLWRITKVVSSVKEEDA